MNVSRAAGPVGPIQGQQRTSFQHVLDRAEVRARVAPPPVSSTRREGCTLQSLAQRVSAAQAQLDSVLAQARSGRTFSPAELLGLQVRVCNASQVIDFAGKAVDKAVGGVKQVLQTPV